MTSSPRRRRTRPIRRWAVIAAGGAAFALVVTLGLGFAWGRIGGESAGEALARSEALLAASNATDARDEAQVAVHAAPENAAAQLALARAMLALQDGIGAEGALQRAVDAGQDPRQIAHLRAHALLLQGEEQKALAEAAKAPAPYRTYALRIRGRALAAQGDFAGALAAFDQAAHAAPNDPALWTDMGRFKFASGDMLGAIQASERAVKLAPGAVDALVLRGELVRAQYGLVAALPWFEAALKRDPRHHDALIEYAATLGDSGRMIDALAATRRALVVRPASPQALYLQAVIAARASNFDLARALMERTGGALDSVPGPLLLLSTLDLESGANEQAIDKLRALIAMQPLNLSARKLLAAALLRSDSARNAIDVLRPMVARADADTYALALAARAFERIGDRASAATLLDRAALPFAAPVRGFGADDSAEVLGGDAAQRPGDPGAAIPYLRALADKGDTAGALVRAQQLAARNPGVPAAHLLVGDLMMLLDRPADAIASYRQAASLRFDEPAMLRLVEACDRARRPREAASALALFLSQNPANLAALRLAGTRQLAAGRWEDAIESLERVRLKIGDEDAALNAELANAYAGAGEIDAAERFGEAAWLLAPANPAAADAYGWALFLAGDTPTARELLEKAVRLAPADAGLRRRLATIQAG
ncbi:MAG: tetratricopeptide repeat protein [Sphingomonas sp.]|uniref:tetratricopeptide repeat protein n=1 Tax=Sphingomonas sp. TaxID=28214 RepID=UPI001B219C17|nr:tetratricopeptide repeat protein [Sphingomonas sp.]MBO9621418.1 tetratricopeptide repeat protein [Sphingomonas sp.]